MKTFTEIIVYDGNCVSCNRFINYVVRNDNGIFKLLTQASVKFEYYSENYDFEIPADESICLISGDSVYYQSEAMRRILARCGSIDRCFAWLLSLIPQHLRDIVYSIYSRHRYRLQKRGSCPLPSSNLLTRLI